MCSTSDTQIPMDSHRNTKTDINTQIHSYLETHTHRGKIR